ncbi:MAG TPA: plastocyanin/azurin family copper-binding protein [Nitrospiria bacterium]|nr:plastocyanin/azurin family copper-binding protein [Nitrospiria bacterium]
MTGFRMAARRLGWSVLVATVCALWPAGGHSIEETPQQKPTLPVGAVHEIVVEKDSFAFSPQMSTVHVGDIVRWTNHDTQKHLVVSQDPKASTRELLIYHTIHPGESYEHQFVRADEYNFFCAIHFQMWGVVTVLP